MARWRWVDLRDEVARRFGMTAGERAIGKWLRKPGLTRLQPPLPRELGPLPRVLAYPYCPKTDPAAEQAFKQDSRRRNKLCSTLWNSCDEIVETRKTAWNWLIDAPDRIRSIGTRDGQQSVSRAVVII